MSPRESEKRPSFRSDRLVQAGLTFTLALALTLPAPASACVKPPDPEDCSVGLWIQVTGTNVMIKARGLMTFGTPAGANCGCGFQQVSSLSGLSATAINRSTGEPLPGFDFTFNANTTADLEDEDSGSWLGLASSPLPQAVPAGIPTDVVFTGTVPAGTTFEGLRDQILNAGGVIGFGEVTNNGSFQGTPAICLPAAVDPLPPPLTAPVLRVTGMDMSSPHTLEVTAQDMEDGLSTIRVAGASNASGAAPSFAPGTRDPVVVRLAMQADNLAAQAQIEACNSRGECATLRPEITPLKQEGPEAASRTLTGVSASKSRILVHNGDPGIRMFSLFVNGRKFSIRPLAPGQSLSLDVSLALSEANNTITLAGRGAALSEAVVVLSEAPTSEQR